MAITSIGSGLETASGTQIAATLNAELAEQIPLLEGARGGHTTVSAAHAVQPAAVASPPPIPSPVVGDVSTTLIQEVATSDLSKLNQILQPVETGESVKVLDTLLKQAIEQVSSGNTGRAVGLLADYATRAPKRAESLVAHPELQPVRPQIDTLIGQMTSVAKMSAEDGLAKADQSAEELPAKLPAWDTKPEVLVKLAHRLFEAGGYANYSRTSELARALTSDAHAANTDTPPTVIQGAGAQNAHAMGAAQGGAVIVPGLTIPYVVGPSLGQQDFAVGNLTRDARAEQRRARAAAASESHQNWEDFIQVSREIVSQVWDRAPLLLMMMAWFGVGLAGGIASTLLRQLSPDSALLAVSDVGFQIWALGFLALVGFGFWMRIRRIRF